MEKHKECYMTELKDYVLVVVRDETQKKKIKIEQIEILGEEDGVLACEYDNEQFELSIHSENETDINIEVSTHCGFGVKTYNKSDVIKNNIKNKIKRF